VIRLMYWEGIKGIMNYELWITNGGWRMEDGE
jgi:hypothetical protein